MSYRNDHRAAWEHDWWERLEQAGKPAQAAALDDANSNTSEVVFEGARPIMFNGIPDLGSRSDFGDRVIHVVLKVIEEADRRSEADYWREVENRLPLIFGAVLDAVAAAPNLGDGLVDRQS